MAEERSASAGQVAPRLAVVIPSFGRAEVIAGSLTAMSLEAQASGVDIAFYVSDDTPDQSVEVAVRALASAGHAIFYRRNTPALGHDQNLVASLLWPDASYVWLMGSALRVSAGQLARVLAFLDGQDLLLVNSHSDDHRLVRVLRGAEARSLLRNALWHQTRTGTTIYGPRVLAWMRAKRDQLRVMPNFPQISVMAGFSSDNDPAIGWFGEPSVESAGGTEASYWRRRPVEVFVHDWAAAVDAFPAVIPPDHRTPVIREHSRRVGLFTTTTLANCKRSGQFGWRSLRNRHFRQAMHEPVWKQLAILALPQPLIAASMAALVWVKRQRNGLIR